MQRGLHGCDKGDATQPLAGKWLLLERLCPHQAGAALKRGDALRRKLCPFPSIGWREGRSCSGLQGEAGDPQPLESRDHTGGMCFLAWSTTVNGKVSAQTSVLRNTVGWDILGKILAAAKKFGSLEAS